MRELSALRGQLNKDPENLPLALHLEAVLLGTLTAEERKSLDSLMTKLADRIAGLHLVPA